MTEQLPPDVIAQLTGMDPAITPELVMTSWALLKPFHDKVGYTAPKVDRVIEPMDLGEATVHAREVVELMSAELAGAGV